MADLSVEIQNKLEIAQNIWFASVRYPQNDGSARPHLVPLWFAWYSGRLYICIEPGSVKSRNIIHNPQVVMALEDGTSPVICEGLAAPIHTPWPAGVAAVFKRKYDWDIATEAQYNQLVEIVPRKWLAW